MTFARQTGLVAVKDLRLEARGRYALGAVLPFAATLLLAFGLSVGPGREILQETAPGLLWMAVLFSSVLAARRSYESETEDGALEGLLLSPIDKAAVFLGKTLAVALQLVVLEAIALLMVAGLFDVELFGDPGALAVTLVAGSIGLSAIGCLFGALDASSRAREAVFPLLVLPVATPALVAAVKATAMATGAEALGSLWEWIGLIVAFDLIILAVGTLVFGHLLED